MKILVATGSFKDVYSPIEVSELIGEAIVKSHDDSSTQILPLCDGGEYTYDVLCHYYGELLTEHLVDSVINPYGKKVTARYVSISKDAYIISSEILHLFPNEDIYKNPLNLTDYGLGQLVKAAINDGHKKINLCLGGTSTVSFGLGCAQALGAQYYDINGELIPEPIYPKDYCKIAHVKWPYSHEYDEIEMTVINDGITRAVDLVNVNPLKISDYFDKRPILSELSIVADKVFELTDLSEDDEFSGNAGGVYYGVEKIFSPQYIKGGEYFSNLFHIRELIKSADIVVTGEGRLDNPHLEKLPITISLMTRLYKKKCIFICGARDSELSADALEGYGITQVICCNEQYDKTQEEISKLSSADRTEYYRANSERIIRKEICANGFFI